MAPRSAALPPIGVHASVAGGVEFAPERAHAIGCTTLQIFTSSPRQWKGATIHRDQAATMIRRREELDLQPLVIHDNYLINLAASDPEIHRKSLAAFRGEIERALALRASYLVMHPGSSIGGDHDQAIGRLTDSIRACAEDIVWDGLSLLIENTAGGGKHLGGPFEEVARILDGLKGLPVACCIDTCHAWVMGYEWVSEKGYAETMQTLDRTIGLSRVPVWHVNDAKAACGSHLDRHTHIGEGQLGESFFRRLLTDPRLRHAAFIAETPVDNPGDDQRNVETLRRLAQA